MGLPLSIIRQRHRLSKSKNYNAKEVKLKFNATPPWVALNKQVSTAICSLGCACLLKNIWMWNIKRLIKIVNSHAYMI